MDNLECEVIQMHQEVIRREAREQQFLRRSGVVNPPILDRGMTMLGDLLISLGTRLKEHNYTRVKTEEATAPTFLIML